MPYIGSTKRGGGHARPDRKKQAVGWSRITGAFTFPVGFALLSGFGMQFRFSTMVAAAVIAFAVYFIVLWLAGSPHRTEDGDPWVGQPAERHRTHAAV